MKDPKFAQIEVVGQCNLRCQMCPIQYRQDGPPFGPPAIMSWNIYQKIVDQLPNLEELHLQGLGEPLIHPQFFSMVTYAVKRGIRVTTNTNLTLLNRRKARLCFQSGLSELHISIDGANSNTYERIRVGSRYDRILKHLSILNEARLEQDKPDLSFHLIIVIMKQNLDELPDLIYFAKEWGFDKVFVQHLCHDFGETTLPPQYKAMRTFIEEQTLLNENRSRITDIFEKARQIAFENDLPLRLPSPRKKFHPNDTPGEVRCQWPWRGMYFSYQGLAMPCCMIATPDRKNFGSIFKKDALKIWNGDDYETFRKQLSSAIPPDICQNCSIYSGTF